MTTKPTSISAIMIAQVEAILRGEGIDPTELPESTLDGRAARWAAEREASARAEHLKLQTAAMLDGGFPPDLVEGAAASWPSETAASRHARQYLTGRKRIIVFAGATGCGKSTAAALVALESGGSSPGFVRAATLERWGRYSKALDQLLERSSLVIDDLGSEILDGRNVFRSLLEEIIDTFYAARRRVAITTNLVARRTNANEEPQFHERYGDRIASRMAQAGVWADCGRVDRRRDQLKLVPGGRQ